MRGTFFLMATIGVALPGVALASGPTLQDRQQAACYNDVMTFCADAVPDVERVTACMKDKRDQVSAPCAAFYPRGRK